MLPAVCGGSLRIALKEEDRHRASLWRKTKKKRLTGRFFFCKFLILLFFKIRDAAGSWHYANGPVLRQRSPLRRSRSAFFRWIGSENGSVIPGGFTDRARRLFQPPPYYDFFGRATAGGCASAVTVLLALLPDGYFVFTCKWAIES